MSELKAKSESAFSDPDSTFEDYRSFSPVSLFAFLFGAISSVIAAVTTWIVAIPALLLCLWCLILLHFRKDKVIGHSLALTGACFCVFAIGANVVYKKARLQYLARTAEEHAMQWLELSQQGKYHETYQLTLAYVKRQQPGTMLPKIYGDEQNPLDDFSTYLIAEPERTIRQDGTGGEFSTLQVNHRESGVDREQFILTMQFKPANKDLGDRVFEVFMERKKHLPQFGPIQWTVFGITNVEPSLNRGLTKEQN